MKTAREPVTPSFVADRVSQARAVAWHASVHVEPDPSVVVKAKLEVASGTGEIQGHHSFRGVLTLRLNDRNEGQFRAPG